MKSIKKILCSAAVAAALAPSFAMAQVEVADLPAESPAEQGQAAKMEEAYTTFSNWYISPGVGFIKFEGDEPLESGSYLTLRLGKQIDEWWSGELSLVYAPKLDENLGGYGWKDADGVYRLHDVRESYSKGAQYFEDTWMAQVYFDMLFHFERWKRLDPYLTAGVGATFYGEDILDDGDSWSPAIRAGGGIMYHFNNVLAFRADARIDLRVTHTEINSTFDLGFVWTWDGGAEDTDPGFVDSGKMLDSDGDGLSDWDEINVYGTDPYNKDTDNDGLSDYDEVMKWHTDPLNPDSDFDMLSDGAEVNIYHTDPLNPDTDNGGVSDGHEVLVDHTDPLDPSDDVILFQLQIQFDTDKYDIKSQYIAELDKVAAVLVRHPKATAVIEGHADRRNTSNARHNMMLSQNRAAAIKDYFVSKKGLDEKRFKANGYGFERPKAPNDPIKGNIENRRVDVYIYGVPKEDKVQYVNPQ